MCIYIIFSPLWKIPVENQKTLKLLIKIRRKLCDKFWQNMRPRGQHGESVEKKLQTF